MAPLTMTTVEERVRAELRTTYRLYLLYASEAHAAQDRALVRRICSQDAYAERRHVASMVWILSGRYRPLPVYRRPS